MPDLLKAFLYNKELLLNLRASLRWLLEREGDRAQIEMTLRLGGALWWFWFVRGPASEGWAVLSQALARSDGVAVAVRAKALWAAGWVAGLSGHSEQAEALCQEIGDTAGVAMASLILGIATLWKNQLAVAHSHFEESLALFGERGDRKGTVFSLNLLARAEALRETSRTPCHPSIVPTMTAL